MHNGERTLNDNELFWQLILTIKFYKIYEKNKNKKVYNDSNLIVHQRPSRFYIIYNDSNLVVFDRLSNDNKTT
jgi:hypothetical protein